MQIIQRTGTDDLSGAPSPGIDFKQLDVPSVFRGRGVASTQVEAMRASGVDNFDIPAFLRKQAD